MRRQMKLIKAILQACSEYPDTSISQAALIDAIDGAEYRDKAVVEYHLGLCRQAGYLEQDGTRGKYDWRLTWNGHEALDRL